MLIGQQFIYMQLIKLTYTCRKHFAYSSEGKQSALACPRIVVKSVYFFFRVWK